MVRIDNINLTCALCNRKFKRGEHKTRWYRPQPLGEGHILEYVHTKRCLE